MRKGRKGINGMKAGLDKFIIETLGSNMDRILSIVLIGSYASGHNEEGSDIDVAVVTKGELCRRSLRKLVDKEYEERMYEGSIMRLDCISPKRAKDMFRTGSPFAHAIKNGRVLYDSGFLKRLSEAEIPSKPLREYYLFAFGDLISMWYC